MNKIYQPHYWTFISILSTGLTEKTTLSFSSSNYSFTNCVRKLNNIHSFTLNYNEDTPQCTIDDKNPTNDECNVSTRNILSENAAYKFISCSFSSLSTNDGAGAAILIFFTYYSDSTLSIDSCSFITIKATGNRNSNDGGCIYAGLLSKVSITSSLFQSCEASDKGGAVFLDTISFQPFLKSCDYISCLATGTSADAGAVAIYRSCGTESRIVCCRCRFIHSICDNTGGGIRFTENQQTLGLSDCIFNDCHGDKGTCIAFWIETDTFTHPIRFCFFYSKNNSYYDVFLSGASALMSSIFLHCVTLTSSKRVEPSSYNN